MSIPSEPLQAPGVVADIAAGRPVAAVWVNELVCHGDACSPNTLIDDDGRFCGHVDLGDLGVADRWADLAVATLSLSWNYAGEWEHELFDAYGVDPDPERVEAYRRLWNACDVSSH